jgi:hypothetical protein
MNSRIMLPLLLLSAAVITPASANWFSNPFFGINRNIGSAPSPTPEQVRQERLPPFVLKDQDSSGTVADASAATKQAPPPAQQPQPQSNSQNVAAAAPSH